MTAMVVIMDCTLMWALPLRAFSFTELTFLKMLTTGDCF